MWNSDSSSVARVSLPLLHALQPAGPVGEKWPGCFSGGFRRPCEVAHAGTATCREPSEPSVGRGEDWRIPGGVGALLRSCACDGHFTRPPVERTGSADDALPPPRWIYGEVVPCALSQLLELLAAAEAAPLGLNSPTWITEDGTSNLI